MNEFDATWSQDVTRIGFGRQGGDSAIYLTDVKARHEPKACSYPTWSRDGAFLQYDTLADKPTLRRIKVGQTQSELLLDLQSLNRYTDSIIGSWSGLAPDGSALVVLDRSTQKGYALELDAQ